MYPQYHILE